MLKISITESSESAVTLLLEGTVMDWTIEQLKASCDQVLSKNQRLTLNMSGVSFVARTASILFRQLRVRGVEIVNCSGLVTEQLAGGVPPDER